MKFAGSLLITICVCSASFANPTSHHSTKSIKLKSSTKPATVKRYTSKDGYSFAVPVDWDLKVDPQVGTVMFHQGGGMINFGVTSMMSTTIDDLQTNMAAINAEATRQDPSLKYTSEKRIMLAGRPGTQSVGTRTDLETQVVSAERMLLIHKSGSDWFEIEYVGPSKFEPNFEKVLQSIEWSPSS